MNHENVAMRACIAYKFGYSGCGSGYRGCGSQCNVLYWIIISVFGRKYLSNISFWLKTNRRYLKRLKMLYSVLVGTSPSRPPAHHPANAQAYGNALISYRNLSMYLSIYLSVYVCGLMLLVAPLHAPAPQWKPIDLYVCVCVCFGLNVSALPCWAGRLALALKF